MTGIIYDSIWTITDLLMKYTYFLLYQEGFTVKQLAYAFQREIIAVYEILEVVISDKELIYTSKFWQILMAQLEVKYKCSTAFHSQIDKQIE